MDKRVIFGFIQSSMQVKSNREDKTKKSESDITRIIRERQYYFIYTCNLSMNMTLRHIGSHLLI